MSRDLEWNAMEAPIERALARALVEVGSSQTRSSLREELTRLKEKMRTGKNQTLKIALLALIPSQNFGGIDLASF